MFIMQSIRNTVLTLSLKLKDTLQTDLKHKDQILKSKVMLLPENCNTKPGRRQEFSHTATHRASTGHFLLVPVQLQEF